MKTDVGVFPTLTDAQRAADHLRSAGIPRVSVLAPGDPPGTAARVRTSDTEQQGIGKAIVEMVGGAIGVAGGMELGTAIASAFLPGVGPVLALGLAGAAVLGAGGVAAGAAVGGSLENFLSDGLPKDELYVYEDALRHGRSVLISFANDDQQADAARAIMLREGAESLDAARESWWLGLRPVEEEHYQTQGRDFTQDEELYRRGFITALHPDWRGKPYPEAQPDQCANPAFRRGYERGREYQRGLDEKYRKES